VFVIVAVVSSTGAGIYLILGGLFEPPVDKLGINISSAYAADELLLDQLINESLN